MEKLFRTLNDPQLVVSFQRYCGVYPAKNGAKNGSAPLQTQTNRNTNTGTGVLKFVSFLNDYSSASDTNINHLATRNGSAKHRTANGSADAVPTVDKCFQNSREGVNHFGKGTNGNAANGSATTSTTSISSTSTSSSTILRKTHQKKDSNCSTDLSATESDSDQNSSSGAIDYITTNSFFYYLFQFGASLGNEVFYITFFPFWFWNIDGYVGRRLCVFWCIFMYLGQATKDIVRWPRPPAPPVIRIEKRYELEYGMPSTHAMVGAGLPFAILILTKDRYVVRMKLSR